MSPEPAPYVVRLNAHTIPMIAEERRVLARLPHRLVEVEGATDDEVLAACRDADAIMGAAAGHRPADQVLCLLCPLLSTTRGMLAMPQLRQMKPTTALINTGRGELVNEDDLAEALRVGTIRYAALDVFGMVNVFDAKGFPTDHPLFTLDNVLFSPHVAAASQEGAVDNRRGGAQAVVDVLSGKWPEHPVDPMSNPGFPSPGSPRRESGPPSACALPPR